MLAVVGIACQPSKRQDYGSGDFSNDNFFGAESNTFEAVRDLNHANSDIKLVGGNAKGAGGGSGGSDGKLGFSSGSGLRSIAQGSAEQANTAVQNQDAAGHQAAYVAKNTLAQAANAVNVYIFILLIFNYHLHYRHRLQLKLL